jgi:Ca-activated chloride channel homolog
VSFDSPWLLVLLVAIPLAVVGLRYLEGRRRRRSTAWAPASLQPNMVRRPPAWRRTIPTALLLVGVALLLVGFARPTASYHVKSQEATVVMVLDVSGSMAADDASPTRIAHAKQIVRDFIKQLPHGYEMALVTFSDHTAVLSPPTHDMSQIEAALGRAKTGPQGTALAEAVEKGVTVASSVKGTVEGKRPPAVVVVLSDGGQTSGMVTIPQATQKARGAGTPVSTILVGTPNGVVHQKLTGGYTEQIQVPAQPQTLQQIATGTSGFYMTGRNVNVKRVLAELGSRVGQREKTIEVTSGLAAGGLVFMLIGGLLSGAWLRRIP